MFYRIYTIFDQVAQQSGPVFQAVNDGVAQRQFKRVLDQPGIVADDFQLWCIGEYDDAPNDGEVCRFEPYKTSRLVDCILEPVVVHSK